MKTLLSFVFAASCTATICAQTLTWSNEIIVANGNTYGSLRPRVTAVNGSMAVVVWGSNSTDRLNGARGNSAGFSMPVPLTPAGMDPAVMSWQGHDVAGTGDTVYMVFKEEPEMQGNIFIRKSVDGGLTWSDTVRVDGMNGPYTRFPSLAVGDTGNPAVMFMTFDQNWLSATYVVSNSNDGGQTFAAPANVSGVGNSDVCDCCPGYMTIDGNRQISTWRRNNNNRRDIWAAVSTNGGASFPTGIDVDNTDWMINSCPSSGPSPYVSGDSLFTVFMSGASGDNRIYLSTFSMLTQTEGFTAELASNISTTAGQNYPFIAGSGDTIMVVWQQLDGSNLNTYYSWSVSGAPGLVNGAILLNSSAAGNQQNPHVAYADGMFHVVFTDAASGNVIYKSAAISPNGIAENETPSTEFSPNPSSGPVTINSEQLITTVTLYDLSGRIVFSSSGVNAYRTVVPKQSPGLYVFEVENDDGSRKLSQVIYTE